MQTKMHIPAGPDATARAYGMLHAGTEYTVDCAELIAKAMARGDNASAYRYSLDLARYAADLLERIKQA